MAREGVTGKRLRRRVWTATAVLAVLFAGVFLVTCPGHLHGQESARLPDLTGTWVVNVAKSNFGGFPAPKADTATYTRDGYVYHVEQAADQGQGLVHLKSEWPTDSGDVTDSLPDGTRVVVKAHVEHGVQLFTSSLAKGGQTATMSGRIELAPDHMTMTRIVTIVPPAGEPVNLRLVYVRKPTAGAP